ncbi:MAG: T9SS type A sorting domain-containing protein, partial [Bacteroidia bacterium]
TPFMYRKNNVTYMLSGSESGRVFLFTNIDNNLSGTFNTFSSDYNYLREGIRTGLFCKDINGDGFDEMWIGNYSGGLTFFSGIAFTGIENEKSTIENIKLFPNPASENITIQLPADYEKGILEMYDISGRLIVQQQLPEQVLTHTVSVGNFQKGVYFLVISKQGMRSISEKMLIK